MDRNERQVRERAYFIWENEGRVFGRAEAHWFQAEAEMRDRAAAPLRIKAVAADALPVASPAEVLKPRAGRTKAAATVTLTDVAAPAEPAAKAASRTASKAKSAAKTAADKAGAAKVSAAKAKPRASRADASAGIALH